MRLRDHAWAGRSGVEHDDVVDRYRSMLSAARADEIERVHAEAFTALRPTQRRRLYAGLSRSAEPADRPWSDDPAELATSATRSEVRSPGFLEHALGGTLFDAVARLAVGTAVTAVTLPAVGELALGAARSALDDAAATLERVGGWGDWAGDLQF